MCLVDLVEETLEFVEALLYQLLTPDKIAKFISTPNAIYSLFLGVIASLSPIVCCAPWELHVPLYIIFCLYFACYVCP